ncbi:coenzyme F420-0:L-glutamate ligase [Halarchaeum nitratireducens]|uniref:F420-0--gamma-glutamyl ligase n=1 Tax=Halarchaeum nitratireducens TaxID=489913 RepID=A0A830G928_9EURY|nr:MULTISPECIES: coenzyme F420-0:L-glutamate ligase [Halarchaeum]MBP2249893.1 coenzyme F420-0:L-glutamate ligase/coenzyme F420-1:gamma-L-glutamate ligase [Halarchaeum solikamskense]GGN09927.1 F420-0--gamma-glutamyl ligase [Halarchaeum nitratireducens]
MPEVTFHGLDIGRVDPNDDLVERIVSTTGEEYALSDGDVIVITAKVVSFAEGRLIEADDVDVTERDRRVAEITGIDPREVAVIYEESDVLGAIPIAEVGEDLLLEHAVDPDVAQEALDDVPSMLVTERNGRLCTNAGVDWSNSPEGKMTLLPKDPDESARRLRGEIEARTGADVAVVLSDSEIAGPGSMDLAIGCSGIEAIDTNFGRADLYDQPKIGGVDLVADELTAGAALLFGQADERVPVVIVRGLEYEDGEGVPNSSGIVRRGLRKSIELTARLKAREWF